MRQSNRGYLQVIGTNQKAATSKVGAKFTCNMRRIVVEWKRNERAEKALLFA